MSYCQGMAKGDACAVEKEANQERSFSHRRFRIRSKFAPHLQMPLATQGAGKGAGRLLIHENHGPAREIIGCYNSGRPAGNKGGVIPHTTRNVFAKKRRNAGKFYTMLATYIERFAAV